MENCISSTEHPGLVTSSSSKLTATGPFTLNSTVSLPLRRGRAPVNVVAGTDADARTSCLSEFFSVILTMDAIQARHICVLLLALEYIIAKGQQKQEGLKLHGTHQLLVCATYVNLLVII